MYYSIAPKNLQAFSVNCLYAQFFETVIVHVVKSILLFVPNC